MANDLKISLLPYMFFFCFLFITTGVYLLICFRIAYFEDYGVIQ
jgi:hypothetical protein